jgi:LysR family glycine cleavage system transcriptional activator
MQGEGVVLGRTMLVSADLAAGRLERPFDHALKVVSSFLRGVPTRGQKAAEGFQGPAVCGGG